METSPCLAHFQHIFTPVRSYFLLCRSKAGFCDQKGSVSRLRQVDECQCYVVNSDSPLNSTMSIKQRENTRTLRLRIPPRSSGLSGDLRPSSGSHLNFESGHQGCLSLVLLRESSVWLTKIKNVAGSWWTENRPLSCVWSPLKTSSWPGKSLSSFHLLCLWHAGCLISKRERLQGWNRDGEASGVSVSPTSVYFFFHTLTVFTKAWSLISNNHSSKLNLTV